VDWRVSQNSMEPTNSSKQRYQILTFFPSLRIRSCITCWPDLDFTKDRAIWRRRSQTHLKTRTGQYSTEEVRVNATLQSARYLQSLRRHYDKSTQLYSVQVGDLVLRRTQKVEGRHKLLNLWEGPFIIAKITELGTYELITEDGIHVKNSWHISQLWRFYA
jgi:hypothetical protein